MNNIVQTEINFQEYFGDLFDDKGNKVSPSTILDWVRNHLNKMDFNSNAVLVIGSPSKLDLQLIKHHLQNSKIGLDIGSGGDMTVEAEYSMSDEPERGIKLHRVGITGFASAVNKLCEEELAETKEKVFTLTNPYHDIQMPFVPKDTKPHPTNWRQSNRNFKRKR